MTGIVLALLLLSFIYRGSIGTSLKSDVEVSHGNVIGHLLQMNSLTRKLDEPQYPYSCGAILLYHIPGSQGTNGNLIIDWLMNLKELNKVSYLSSLDLDLDSDMFFENYVGQRIHNMATNEWIIIHAQDNSISLETNERVLQDWRDKVENQRCRMIVATVFTDPLNHSIWHTKNSFFECDCSSSEFKDERNYNLSEEPWRGQLDYFLFNNGKMSEMEIEDKVKRGMQLLKNHFDIVILDNHHNFFNIISMFTGWSSPGELQQNDLSETELLFTKDLVKKYENLATKNGDADFIDAISHVYYNNLDFLLKNN